MGAPYIYDISRLRVKAQSRGLFISTIPMSSFISDYLRGVTEILALLGCYAALIGSHQYFTTTLLSHLLG